MTLKDEPEIQQRLSELLGDNSVNSFAVKCEVPESSMRKYFKGSMPGLDRASQIAKANGVTLEWLANGTLPKYAKGAPDDIGVEFVFVPQYDVEAAAGAGKVVERESEVNRLAFRRDWMEQKGVTAKDIAAIRISGDSMAPTIRDGSLVLVDTRQEKVKEDGIYVVMTDGHLIAKRLQIDFAKGGLYIVSDNPSYREQYLKPDELENLYVIGRIIWAGGDV